MSGLNVEDIDRLKLDRSQLQQDIRAERKALDKLQRDKRELECDVRELRISREQHERKLKYAHSQCIYCNIDIANTLKT